MNHQSSAENEPAQPIFLRSVTDSGQSKYMPVPFIALLVVGLAGVGFDWAMRSGVAALSMAILTTAVPLALAYIYRDRGRNTILPLIAMPLFGVWFVVRESGWLLPLDLLALITLGAFAASYSSGGSSLDATFPQWILRALRLAGHVITAPAVVLTPLFSRSPKRLKAAAPFVRGLLIVSPVVLVLGLLLISADSVFASLFDWDLQVGEVFIHIVLITMGAWVAGSFVRAASAQPAQPLSLTRLRLSATEALTALGAITLLFLVFVVTQMATWLGGAEHVLDKHGLTYAEHARQGYFQLLAVAVIAAASLGSLRAVIQTAGDAQRKLWRWVSTATIALTLVIVGEALHRLAMYEHAFGLTMLRLYATVFAVWIAVVFVMLAVYIHRTRTDETAEARSGWFPTAILASALVFLFALNTANPDAFVVNRNVDRLASTTIPLDTDYLYDLSADARPAMINALKNGKVPASDVHAMEITACSKMPGTEEHPDFGSYNFSAAKAYRAMNSYCYK